MRRAFLRSPTAFASLVGIVIILLVVVFAPTVYGERADDQSIIDALQKPSADHWFGTDGLGRDLFARTLVATRLSLGLAAGAVLISAGFGITLGALASVMHPRLRTVVLRLIDMMIAFPGLILAIYVGTIVGPGNWGPVLGVGIGGSFGYARLTSALAMSIAGREFIQAARVTGVKRLKLIYKYVLPNAAETLIVATTVSITTAIVALSGLSFLGLGVQAPAYDWGQLLTTGVNQLYLNPMAALGPALAIVLSAVTLGLFGEAMARAANPLIGQRARLTRRQRHAADLMTAATGLNQTTSDPIDTESSHATVDETKREVDDVEHEYGTSADARGLDHMATPQPRAIGLNGDGLDHSNDASFVRSQDVVASAGRCESDTAPDELALSVRDLRISFPSPNGWVEVVCGVSFDMAKKDRIGIVGESGSGKTMTALALAQLVPYPARVTGTIQLSGKDLGSMPSRERSHFLATELAVVFQDPMASLNPALRIGTQLTEGVEHHRKIKHADALALAANRLREVNIGAAEQQLKRHPHEFSGGMRQRALIAMGLMSEPRLLIADEPTTALDVTIQAQIMDLLDEVSTHRKAALVLISHNLALVRQNTDRLLVMYSGRIVEEISSDHLADARHPYTSALLAAVPDLTIDRHVPLVDIPGQAPDPGSRPPGCAYNDRCPFAVDKCRTETPPLVTVAPGERVACWVAIGGRRD